jgi:L-threonylcarbamoyladenylate synthase
MREDINKSLEVLRRGGVILYPTDTIWGIGCDATDEAAIQRIYDIKRRNESRAMLTLVDSFEMLAKYVEHFPSIVAALRLTETSDRPVTFIYPEVICLAPNLKAEDGSLGIRVVNEPFCQQLIKEFGKPIVSTSANISGSPSPTLFDEITEEIKTAVDYIVRWRQDDRQAATASSIIKLNLDGSIIILR